MDNEFYCPMKMTTNPLGRCVCEKEKCAWWKVLCRLADCTEAIQYRNEDEEVRTLGDTPEAWSWQTAADRS